MKRYTKIVFFSLISLFGVAQAEDFRNLTLREVEYIALQQNQNIQASIHRLHKGYYAYEESKFYLYPQIGVEGDLGWHRDDFKGDSKLTAWQMIYDRAAFYNTKVFEGEYAVLKLDLERKVCDTLFRVREVYYNMHHAQTQLAKYHDKVKFFQKGIRDFENKAEAEQELNGLKLELAKANGDREKTQLKLQLATYELLKVLSLPPETTITLEEKESSFTPEELNNIAFEQPWLAKALEFRPEIRKMRILIDMGCMDENKVKAAYTPKVNLFANIGHDYGDPHWKTGLEFEWKLFDGARSSRINKIKETKKAIQSELSQLELETEFEIKRLKMELETTFQAYQNIQNEETKSQTTLNAVLQKQQQGFISPQEYHEAINKWEITQRDLHHAKIELLKAYYRLVNLCGLDLEEECLNNIPK